MSGRRSWGRLAIEGAVIVGSILLAFGIEAWWDERGDLVREQEAIAQLTVEFEAVANALDSLAADYRGDRSGLTDGALAARTLLNAMGRDLPAATVDSLVAGTITVPRADLPEGVLSSLVSSGDFALIRSDSLRAALGAWPAFRRTVEADVRGSNDFVNERLLPYLYDRIAVRAVDVQTGYHEELGPGPFPHDAVPLLFDRYFENLINERLIYMETNLERVEEARAHVQRTLELLRASTG